MQITVERDAVGRGYPKISADHANEIGWSDAEGGIASPTDLFELVQQDISLKDDVLGSDNLDPAEGRSNADISLNANFAIGSRIQNQGSA